MAFAKRREIRDPFSSNNNNGTAQYKIEGIAEKRLFDCSRVSFVCLPSTFNGGYPKYLISLSLAVAVSAQQIFGAFGQELYDPFPTA